MAFVVHRGGCLIRKSHLPLPVMHFKSVIRRNSETGNFEGYYRLVESYRNMSGRVCHRTLLNIGFLPYGVEKLNSIRRILPDRFNCTKNVFEEEDEETIRRADTIGSNWWRAVRSIYPTGVMKKGSIKPL